MGEEGDRLPYYDSLISWIEDLPNVDKEYRGVFNSLLGASLEEHELIIACYFEVYSRLVSSDPTEMKSENKSRVRLEAFYPLRPRSFGPGSGGIQAQSPWDSPAGAVFPPWPVDMFG
ncbi:hypothetical protein E2562_026232 [Oryza meyeriana var. granulata]|uniref:Uncharacterized protein n=1 Tax=Oryza meyeriana var. granulata TaxID=110450 RepID=A0A6G1CIM2_9ORYZ|nr:hypothetical protein E2562_026232 [Oryza meyeriana var. granulata]